MKLLFGGIWLVLKWSVLLWVYFFVGIVKVVRAAVKATQRLQATAHTMPHPRRYFWVRFSILPAIVVITFTAAGVSYAVSPTTHLTSEASGQTTSSPSATPDPVSSPDGNPSARPTGLASDTPTAQSASDSGNSTGGSATGILPNSARTPGAINPAVTQANIGQTICVSGWTTTVRPSSSVTTALKIEELQSGYSYNGDLSTADYEEDHLISLELGGSPASPLNLWPEPYNSADGARVKDQLENKLHSLVCSNALSLAAAQTTIASNWWLAYEKYVGTTSNAAPAPAPVARAPVAPVANPPAPAPPPPAAPPTKTDVTPGAFCSPGGAFGTTATGTPMQCKTSATDTRNRWRAA